MEEKLLTKADVLKIAAALPFIHEGCWLTAGAALVLHGIKSTTHDVDIVCTTGLADRLEGDGIPVRRAPDGTRIFAYSQEVELLENWATDEVVTVEGLPAASVLSIRKQKEAQGRAKDWADIALIDRALGRGSIRLETPRLVLRDYTPADEEEYYQLKTHPKTMYYLQDIMLHSREEAREDFRRVLEDAARPDRRFYFLRAELKTTGQQVGTIGYTVTDRTPVGKLVGAGYFYLPEFWGQGFGTEALSEVIRFAFMEDGVYRISTGCLTENAGSERVMQKCGMILESDRPDWEWHDGKMKSRREYRLLRGEYLKEK